MSDTNDMRAVIVPKSDQLNADDLLAGARTITVSGVTIRPGTEQPVSIHFEGDGGKPWKPCKSMARVMVHCWGPDAAEYVGRSLTLYCDPKVKWGGMAVGGIRISHLSHIGHDVVMALTETKGSRKPFTVKPLVVGTVNDGLIRAADAAAAQGMAAYAAFFKARTKDEQRALQAGHEARKDIAAKADNAGFDEAVAPETGEVTETAAHTATAPQPQKTSQDAGLSPESSAGLESLRAANTEADIDGIWERLSVEACREIGADRLDEIKARLVHKQAEAAGQRGLL